MPKSSPNGPASTCSTCAPLRRNALKEKENNKPPKNFRAIFQILQELDQKGAAGRPRTPEDE